MSLPRAVQAQLDRVAELELALQQEQQPAAEPQETATPPDPEPAPPTQQEPPPQPPATPPQDDATTQAYRTLQGKYNSEVPQLQRALAERDRTFTEMQREIAMLKEQASRPAPQAPEAKVDPKDVENFGADLVDMVSRVTGATLSQQAAPLVQRFDAIATRLAAIEEQVKGVDKQQGATAEQLFYADLNRRVSDWETINVDPTWLAWLGETDPVYGQSRQNALDAAGAAMNAERAAAIFNAFKAGKAPTKPARSDDLSRQVAPPKSGAAAAPVASEPRVWTRAQILSHYDKVRRGELTPEVEARMETEINAAISEGRVK